ncbi:MAG: AAA family ATPase, partial [Desulfovibrionales bacterium]
SAFKKAEREKSLLIFDEADSLLQDRSNATQSWEVTQVNEMLTWMESHPFPFVCTTNLYESLDPASMRRFTFKIFFDYLTDEHLPTAFTKFFNMPAPRAISWLEQLTPADFALVRKRAEYLGCSSDGERLLEMLQAESETKTGKRKIGFAKRG